MNYALLVKNVDGARIATIFTEKPDAEALRYVVGGMWEDDQEQELIDTLLKAGYYEVGDSACTHYELEVV